MLKTCRANRINFPSLVSVQLFQAEKEPLLSSFLYASILSHDCMERALTFVLANRLQNPTLLATQLMDIFDDVMMHDSGIKRSIRLDAQVILLLYTSILADFPPSQAIVFDFRDGL
ncbi:hypothetical protein ACLOJK_002387 [Asimina triloba]